MEDEERAKFRQQFYEMRDDRNRWKEIALKYKEALHAIAEEGWIDGQKTSGPYASLSEEGIARKVLADVGCVGTCGGCGCP